MSRHGDASTSADQPPQGLARASLILAIVCFVSCGVAAAGLTLIELDIADPPVLGDISAVLVAILGVPLIVSCLVALSLGVAALVRARRRLVRAGKGLAIAAMLLSITALGLFGAARGAFLRLHVRSIDRTNLHGIGTACRIYAGRHGGQLPPDGEAISAIVGGPVFPKWFRCWHHSEESRLCYTYIPGQLATDDPRNVIVYGQPGCLSPRAAYVLFLDGRVEWVVPYSHVLDLIEQTKARLAARAASGPAGR